MSLLDTAKKEVGTTANATTANATTANATTANATTAAKKSSNNDYQKKARAKRLESAQVLKDELTSKKVELSDKAKEALDYLCGVRKASTVFGTPVFTKLFGESPKVGDKVTALKVFETTGKGFAEMRKLIKQWKEKDNHEVAFDEASKSYVIKSL